MKEKEKEEKFIFKALPIKPGILERKTLAVKKATKKALTVPKPFHFKIEERIPERPKKITKKVAANSQGASTTTFRARPLPDFARHHSSLAQPTRKPLTQPKPFHLKTTELASSPRPVRIAHASESIKSRPTTTVPTQKKRATTTPKPFNFTTVVRVPSPNNKQGPSASPKAMAYSPERVKSKKP